jgi:hypothetical protein
MDSFDHHPDLALRLDTNTRTRPLDTYSTDHRHHNPRRLAYHREKTSIAKNQTLFLF